MSVKHEKSTHGCHPKPRHRQGLHPPHREVPPRGWARRRDALRSTYSDLVDGYLPGTGTLINVVTILVGGSLGILMGGRLPDRTRSVVTDCLGLVTLLMAASSAVAVADPALAAAIAPVPPVLLVLAALLLGGIIGSLLRIESRLQDLADAVLARWGAGVTSAAGTAESDGTAHVPPPAIQARSAATPASAGERRRARFVEGWLTTTLLFCVGPLTILGSLSDGMGRGYDQLTVKAFLDGFAAMAFAATYGASVLASAASVLVIQGALTFVGWSLGAVMPDPHIAALTATGGLMLGGLALRLLRVRDLPVGDLLPALVIAPLLTHALVSFT